MKMETSKNKPIYDKKILIKRIIHTLDNELCEDNNFENLQSYLKRIDDILYQSSNSNRNKISFLLPKDLTNELRNYLEDSKIEKDVIFEFLIKQLLTNKDMITKKIKKIE